MLIVESDSLGITVEWIKINNPYGRVTNYKYQILQFKSKMLRPTSPKGLLHCAPYARFATATDREKG